MNKPVDYHRIVPAAMMHRLGYVDWELALAFIGVMEKVAPTMEALLEIAEYIKELEQDEPTASGASGAGTSGWN